MQNKHYCGMERKTPPRFPKVDAAIKAKGSVHEFVRRSGIHIQTYYKMQSGATVPTLGTIYAVLRYTGLGFDEAFGEENWNAQ